MIKSIVILFVCFISFSSNGQKAHFFADTIYMNRDWRENPHFTSMHWEIQGQTMSWGDSIEVDITPNQMDTIFFSSEFKARDTIICDIRNPWRYRFIHNACCGSFNVLSRDKNHRLNSYVIFKTSEEVADSTVLGTLGESASFLFTDCSDTVKTQCRSAMASNIIPIEFGQIAYCDTGECLRYQCLMSTYDLNYSEGMEDDYVAEYYFSSIYLNMLYMPLNSNPLTITYDFKKNKITFSTEN